MSIPVKAYYINFDKDVARRKSIEQMLNRLKIEYSRIPVIKYSEIPDEDMKMFNKYSSSLSPAEISLFYNHIRAWKQGLAEGYNHVLVMEDDIITYIDKKVFPRMINEAFTKLTFDILYLGKCLDTCSLYEHQFGRVYKTYTPYCTHAYILSADTIKSVLQENLTKPFVKPVDNHLRDRVNSGQYTAYVFHPSIFVQDVVRFESRVRNKLTGLNNIIECADNIPNDSGQNGIYVAIIVVIVLVVIIMVWVINR